MPEIIFNGTAGRLQGRYTPSKIPNAPLALLMSPHPQHGGTFNNKIIHILQEAFVKNGFATLRFNYRGVGRSQGSYDDGIGELADAASALDWMQAIHKNPSALWVGGFSFGSMIAMQLLMRRPEMSGFISIAPPANLYDYSFLAPCPVGGLVVHAEQDTIVSQESVDGLVERIREQRGHDAIDYRMISGANHFFHGCEQALLDEITNYVADTQNFRRMAAE